MPDKTDHAERNRASRLTELVYRRDVVNGTQLTPAEGARLRDGARAQVAELAARKRALDAELDAELGAALDA